MLRTPAIFLGVGLFLSALASSGDQIPASLAQAALSNYPPRSLCLMQLGDPNVLPSVPISEDVQRGWIQAKIDTLSPNGPQVAAVVYKRFDSGLAEAIFLKLFASDGQTWQPMALSGVTDWWVDLDGGVRHNFEIDTDVVFSDLNADGRKEIVLYDRRVSPRDCPPCQPEGVIVLAWCSGTLATMTQAETPSWDGPFGSSGPCSEAHTYLSPAAQLTGDAGVGFVDLDGDGVRELLIYPNFGYYTDPDTGMTLRDVPTTGTRVYKLVNGVYTFQYETPVGTSGMPPIGAAMKPAAVSVDELQGVGGGHGGQDQAIALYVMPPQGVTLNDVDWTSLRIGDFTIAPTADRGVSPAPSPQPSWIPFSFAGRSVLLEQLAGNDVGQFQEDPKDPRVYMGMSGRLHFTTTYHGFRFPKTSLFTWAWQQWQAEAGDVQLKACIPQGSHQRCFTPLHIPVKANLTGNRGFAMGEAILWIETREPAVAAATPAPSKH